MYSTLQYSTVLCTVLFSSLSAVAVGLQAFHQSLSALSRDSADVLQGLLAFCLKQ